MSVVIAMILAGIRSGLVQVDDSSSNKLRTDGICLDPKPFAVPEYRIYVLTPFELNHVRETHDQTSTIQAKHRLYAED